MKLELRAKIRQLCRDLTRPYSNQPRTPRGVLNQWASEILKAMDAEEAYNAGLQSRIRRENERRKRGGNNR